MSTNLHRVVSNTRWRIEALTPSHVYGPPDSPIKFRRFDPFEAEPANTSGWVRAFFVHWLGSSLDIGATNLDIREAIHPVFVHIIYPPAALPYEELEAMWLQDRHDIIKAMRDQAQRAGYDADNTTGDIGLMVRRRGSPDTVRAGGELIPGLVNLNPNILQLVIELHCEVREEE
jgi:hypothetical protein